MTHRQSPVRGCCLGATACLLWATVAGAACPPHPSIILLIADDLDWGSLPFFNPALRPERLTSSTIDVTKTTREYRKQSHTMNRLDARMCATGTTTGSYGTCAGASAFLVGAADGIPVPGPFDPPPNPPPYSTLACQSLTRLTSCDGAADILPGVGGLNRLAQGAVFSRFYATAAVCTPTRGSMMTGRPGPKTGTNHNFPLHSERLKPHEVSIGEYLRQRCQANTCFTDDGTCPAGLDQVCYTTGHIGKWHVFPGHRPEDEGFTEAITYEGAEYPYMKDKPWRCSGPLNLNLRSNGAAADPPLGICTPAAGGEYEYGRSSAGPGLAHKHNCWDTEHRARVAGDGKGCPLSTRHFADLAENFIDRHAADPNPFFLVVAFTDTHRTHRAPDRTREHYQTLSNSVRPLNGKTSFWALMEELDAGIGRILDKLESTGLLDQTLVLFTSDQGPEIDFSHGDPVLRGGKETTFERGIRVPFLARACSDDHFETTQLVSHVDLFRTIAEAAALPVTAFPRGGDLCGCESGGLCVSCPPQDDRVMHDVDGTSFYQMLQQHTAQPVGRPRRNFVFARHGATDVAVSSRKGYYAARLDPSHSGGVCGHVGPLPSQTSKKYAQVRAGSCTPCASDANCQSVPNCQVLGKRCAPYPPEPLAERAQCDSGSTDCSTGPCREVDEQAEGIFCNKCLLGEWKWMTGTPQGDQLYDLATNPEEDDRLNCAAAPAGSEVAAIKGDLEDKLSDWKQTFLWDRCELCPSPAQGGPSEGCTPCEVTP